MENNKNFFLAIALSMMVVVVYQLIFPPSQPTNPPITEEGVQVNTPTSSTQTTVNNPITNDPGVSSTSSQQVDGAEQEIARPVVEIVKVESPLYSIELSTQGGVISSMNLKEYNYSSEQKIPIYSFIWDFVTGQTTTKPEQDLDRKVNMVNEGLSDLNKSLNFTVEEGKTIYYTSAVSSLTVNGTKSLNLVGSMANGLRIEKTLVFEPDSYVIKMNVKVTNSESNDRSLSPVIFLGGGNEPIIYDPPPNEIKGVSQYDTEFDTYTTSDIVETQFGGINFDWIGITSHYFAVLLKKPNNNWNFDFKRVELPISHGGLTPLGLLAGVPSILKTGEVWKSDFEFYLGPKDTEYMDKFDIRTVNTLEMTFTIIAQPMINLLRWFYQFTKNWGVSIILLTFVVRLLILPLAYKGMKSMKRMGKVTPKIQALKAKYKDDKERFNKEVMEMYKKQKINPMGGCLPLLVQIPVFIALYSALMPAIELRHSPFIFWIDDLSQQDYTMILPLLCGSTMFFQQMITPTPATIDPMQKKIMRFFPIMMFAFFAFTSSGLVLYWTISGFVSVLQQYVFNKYNP